MRFREVRRKEVEEIRETNRHSNTDKQHYAFQDIKPESNLTFEECNAFWDNLFQNGGLAAFGKEEE